MSRARQFEMFPKPPRPYIWRMHVIDVANDGPATVKMRCQRCDHVSDWIAFETVTEAKRGAPCPECNQQNCSSET